MGDAAAGGIVWKVMSIAFPLFFTNVFGLSFADAAVLMLVARMFDVVTDPLMGSLADRTQSRFGTYRPWLIYGAVPFGLVFALLLYTPDFGPVGKRIYAYALYLLMMAVYTMVNVPYGSLLGVMTEDDDEKNQFSSFRMVGAYAMGFATLLSFPYLQEMVGRYCYPSVCRYRCHPGCRCSRDDPGLRSSYQGAAEAEESREVLLPPVCRPGTQQGMALHDRHSRMYQLLQWLPLCCSGLYVRLLSAWQCHHRGIDHQLHGVHGIR